MPRDARCSVRSSLLLFVALAGAGPAAGVTVITSHAPIVEDARVKTGATVSSSELGKVPGASDLRAILQTVPGTAGNRVRVSCGPNRPLLDLSVQQGRSYVARAALETPNGWGFGYESQKGLDSVIHLVTMSETCVPAFSHSRKGQDLEVVRIDPELLDLFETPWEFWASFLRPAAGGGTEVYSLPFNVAANGKFTFGGELRWPLVAPGKYNYSPQLDFNPVTGIAQASVNVCEQPDSGCQRILFGGLNLGTFALVPNSKVTVQINPPYQLLPGGTDLRVAPSGESFLAHTFEDPFQQRLRAGGIEFDAKGNPVSVGVPFFDVVGGSSFATPSSVQPRADYWAMTAENYQGGVFSGFVATAPIPGSLQPTPPVQIGTEGDDFINLQLDPALRTFFLQPESGNQAAPAAALPLGAYEQRLKFEDTCQAGPTTLCLRGGRFKVLVTHVTDQGTIGAGNAFPISNDTGYFTFFNPANVELLVKVVDGCGLGGRYWVFAGGLTDVKTIVTVTDTSTGQMVVIANPQGTPFAPYQNTAAFACGAAAATADARPAPASAESAVEPLATAAAPAGAGCQPDSTHLCLNGGRFEVSTVWTTKEGATGAGQAVPLPAGGGALDTGYFWFFSPANVEMVVKVLNACGLNQRHWVFAGGLTNVRVVTTVRDTATGVTKTYTNPQNKPFVPVQDTGAFATCP